MQAEAGPANRTNTKSIAIATAVDFLILRSLLSKRDADDGSVHHLCDKVPLENHCVKIEGQRRFPGNIRIALLFIISLRSYFNLRTKLKERDLNQIIDKNNIWA